MDNTAPYLPKPEIEILSSSNINSFLEEKPDRPKVLLFSDRKTPSFILKAISHVFFDTMCVGFITSTEESLVKRFKVSKYPTLLLVRKKNEKPILYKGATKLNDIFDFLNVYAEKFITGSMKDQLKEANEKLMKPWLTEDIPELTRDSINDVCLNTGKLCVIYISDKEPNENTKQLLKKYKEKYASENRFVYMWLNAALEENFFSIFQLEHSELPKLVFLNVGSFKRVLIHQGDIEETELQKTFDSILNADARFTRINAKSLPELVQRDVIPKTDL